MTTNLNGGSALFRCSPFALVASDEYSLCWAGRAETLLQLNKLCRAWGRRGDSTLDLMWANLGAGKTHAMLHLRHLAATHFSDLASTDDAIVVFVELPEHIKHFKELYEKIILQLPLVSLMQSALAAPGELSLPMQRAAHTFTSGGPFEQQITLEWLSGGKPTLKDLRATTGITSRIEEDTEAEEFLVELLGIASRQRRRVILLVDEFQRVGHLPTRTRDALLSHLRSIFSRRATNFSVVLAAGTRMEKTALELLPNELKTIMGMRPAISLPEMNKSEAKQFLLERLAWFRSDAYAGTHEAPFTPEIIDLVIEFMEQQTTARLIPRTILQTFGLLYDDMEDDSAVCESAENIRELLATYRWDA
jgi:hypothetical protein